MIQSRVKNRRGTPLEGCTSTGTRVRNISSRNSHTHTRARPHRHTYHLPYTHSHTHSLSHKHTHTQSNLNTHMTSRIHTHTSQTDTSTRLDSFFNKHSWRARAHTSECDGPIDRLGIPARNPRRRLSPQPPPQSISRLERLRLPTRPPSLGDWTFQAASAVDVNETRERRGA